MAVELVQMALVVTDTLSAQVLASGGVDTTNMLSPVSSFLVGSGALVDPGVPAFVVFIGGLLVAIATLVLWLELVVRAAAVSVATLFLPLALAALVWPAVSHWCRRLADTLVALILSKLVIAAVLSLAAGALAGGLGLGATGGDGGGFAAVVTGIALLVIATASPFTLLRLIPAIEAGATSHLESSPPPAGVHRHRPLCGRARSRPEIAQKANGGDDAASGAGGALAGAAVRDDAGGGVRWWRRRYRPPERSSGPIDVASLRSAAGAGSAPPSAAAPTADPPAGHARVRPRRLTVTVRG